jgi:aldehyde dehydrogenase (NAD+)
MISPKILPLLEKLGVADDARLRDAGGRESATVTSPIDGKALATVHLDDAKSLDETIARSVRAFEKWREVPAPQRGQLVRQIGDEVRRLKEPLGMLVSLEVGKIISEGQGEVQETVDIADFAVGLSRQLYGLTMPSEREKHRMFEQWLPLGPVGVISAFNFPNAVWAWNAMLAAVCGDSVIWKPSILAPLTAIASNAIARRVAKQHGHEDVFTLVMGNDKVVGEGLVRDARVPLISATGSTGMGKRVGAMVAERLGRSLLELGGNNAAIVHHDADLSITIPAVVFAAAGTCGQRCTTTRRLIAHESIAEKAVEKIVNAYRTLKIGDPTKEGNLVGPLINQRAVDTFLHAVAEAQKHGGRVVIGGKRAAVAGCEGGFYVEPTVIVAPASGVRGRERAAAYAEAMPIAMEETFAPILYVFTYQTPEEAIAIHNAVSAGLSSACFTDSVRFADAFLSPSGTGSDCGIANVNAGTSGAEIGGAFGGEKDTGGGRESGSDSWKAYMRRQTCTVNHGTTVKLAQGVRFD